MFIRFSLFGALTLLSASSALALTCANDYGSSAGCASNTTAAGDCTTLGYSKDNVDGCEHYLYCPFDTSYKRCATEKTPTNGATVSLPARRMLLTPCAPQPKIATASR